MIYRQLSTYLSNIILILSRNNQRLKTKGQLLIAQSQQRVQRAHQKPKVSKANAQTAKS